MSADQEFAVTVNGIDYRVYANTNNNNDHFLVTANNGRLVVTDSFGECNPLRSLWRDFRYQSVNGAPRYSMEAKCIKKAVAAEVVQHMEFCLQLVEEDLAAS